MILKADMSNEYIDVATNNGEEWNENNNTTLLSSFISITGAEWSSPTLKVQIICSSH